jgi:hypothetical protein
VPRSTKEAPELRRTPLLTNLNFGEYPFHAIR